MPPVHGGRFEILLLCLLFPFALPFPFLLFLVGTGVGIWAHSIFRPFWCFFLVVSPCKSNQEQMKLEGPLCVVQSAAPLKRREPFVVLPRIAASCWDLLKFTYCRQSFQLTTLATPRKNSTHHVVGVNCIGQILVCRTIALLVSVDGL